MKTPLREYSEKTKITTLQVQIKLLQGLKLAKKRVEHAHIEDNCAELVYDKISSTIKWLNRLKDNIISVTNKSELLELHQYKKMARS